LYDIIIHYLLNIFYMKTSTIIWIIVIILIIGGGIYWLTSSQSTSAPTTTQSTTTAPSPTPTLSLGSNAQFPSYLAAINGMALYTFKSDTSGVSNCTGSCATIWPPYTVSSASGLSAGVGVTGTIGTITRTDGTLQVTYNGMPLYFFDKDVSTGDVTGNGQGGFSVALATATQATIPAKTPAKSTPVPTTPTPAPTYNY
jgi:predicted lipoprotein with Yx(FWY)xxD motif